MGGFGHDRSEDDQVVLREWGYRAKLLDRASAKKKWLIRKIFLALLGIPMLLFILLVFASRHV
jgi:hypothetical protein